MLHTSLRFYVNLYRNRIILNLIFVEFLGVKTAFGVRAHPPRGKELSVKGKKLALILVTVRHNPYAIRVMFAERENVSVDNASVSIGLEVMRCKGWERRYESIHFERVEAGIGHP